MPLFHTDVIQGTSAWLKLRSGIPTASEFDKIITPKTQRKSESQEPYMYRLLAERIMGHPIEGYMSLPMERGSREEESAVRFYELQTDSDTVPVGFVTNDAKTIGASPDRLVGEPGLLEIKVPNAETHMAYLLSEGGAYDRHKVQVQGQLWITEREWVDVLSWHPELPPALMRTGRDEKFIEKLAELVTEFSVRLEEKYEMVLGRGWVTPIQDVVADQLARSIQRLAPLDELVKQAQEAGHRP